ncbi:MAG TPA: Nif3-like dinuclear metal center hexameric protein [Planctomycetaceae bacterium]|nr:Nif3-like dinuclear metal center hexameric protein [Planctomycetaceae bacterium]
MNVGEVCDILADVAPLRLAEGWDNVGLLVGDRGATAARIMTCLTITPVVVEEAVRQRVDLVITHHPLPFKPLAKITTDSTVGAMLLSLIAAEIAVYSAHTAFDSAASGINQAWASGLGAATSGPLVPADRAGGQTDTDSATAIEVGVGSGRWAMLPGPLTLDQLARSAARVCAATDVRVVGSGQEIWKVAIACGSGGSFLQAALACGCQAMITGEATFHTCLEAEALGIDLVLVGHFASERFAMVQLASDLHAAIAAKGSECDVFASSADVNPLRTIMIT